MCIQIGVCLIGHLIIENYHNARLQERCFRIRDKVLWGLIIMRMIIMMIIHSCWAVLLSQLELDDDFDDDPHYYHVLNLWQVWIPLHPFALWGPNIFQPSPERHLRRDQHDDDDIGNNHYDDNTDLMWIWSDYLVSSYLVESVHLTSESGNSFQC